MKDDLYEYASSELDKFMENLYNEFEYEYDEDMYDLARQILEENPDAFKNFL